MNQHLLEHNHPYLLRLFLAGMEFCWAYAWLVFFSQGLTNRLFPLTACITAFSCSTLLTAFLRKTGFRIISVILLHATGFIVVTLCLIHLLQSVFDLIYIQNLLTQHFNIPDRSLQPAAIFLISILLFAGISLFWIQGDLFAGRTISSDMVISRFDSGIRSFFYLIFVNTLIIRLSSPIAELFLFPFVFFSLLAIALARNEIEETRVYMNGGQRAGAIIGFSVVTVFLSTAVILLFIPYLKYAAVTGYTMLKWLFVPAVNWIQQIFQSVPSVKLSKTYDIGTTFQHQGSPLHADNEFVELIFRGVVIAAELIVLTVLCLVAFHLLKKLLNWLLSRTEADTPAFQYRNLFCRMFAWFGMILYVFKNIIFRGIRHDDSASRMYARLLSWGRRGGFPVLPAETPAAYGSRLAYQFPDLCNEIGLIIDMYNREVYGGKKHHQHQIRKISLALKTLKSLQFWPLRIRRKLKGGSDSCA